MAQMRALTFDSSRESWSASTGMVLERVEAPTLEGAPDRERVLIEVMYAGFCGTDRGIWSRKSMGDMVLGSLATDGATRRIFGHELLGRIVAVGDGVTARYGFRPGDIVSTESHIVCGTCYQCQRGQEHVCANERIIGVSVDGCFADWVKLPAKALWPTNLGLIRPEVAAVQEPFGNAVHACQAAELRGQTVAILGTGTIGLFAVLVARGMGAKTVIGVDPDPGRRAMALALGADLALDPGQAPVDAPAHHASAALSGAVRDATGGVGADVVLEMAGFPASVNNALHAVRRGGDVVLFGLRNGEMPVQDFHRIIMNGLQIHGVVGRRIFKTWEITKSLLESTDNGIQRAIWEIILQRGEGSVVDIADFERGRFAATMDQFPKPILKFAGH